MQQILEDLKHPDVRDRLQLELKTADAEDAALAKLRRDTSNGHVRRAEKQQRNLSLRAAIRRAL